MNGTDTLETRVERIQRGSLIVGIVGLAATAAGAFLNPSQFYRSYLTGYLLWFGIALGSVAVVSLSHLVGGAWGVVSRRLMEAAARTLPLMTLLFVPVLFGMHLLYAWTRPEVVAGDEIIRSKQAYLNVPFFLARTAIYFASWLLLSHLLNKWSLERDRTGDLSISGRLRALSAGGLILYVLTATFASVDWLVSLEPHWYSSIYGAMFVSGQGLSTLAFVIIVLSLVGDFRPFSGFLQPKQFHDLGNLLLAFVMLWAYMAFSQYLIIWSGNLQSEIPWYVRRSGGGWGGIALVLILFHFAAPFAVLLSRQVKRNPRYLAKVAVGLLFLRIIDYYWMVEPPFEPAGPQLHWLDIAAPVGLGGLWLAAYLRELKQRPLLPRQDPEFDLLLIHPEEV